MRRYILVILMSLVTVLSSAQTSIQMQVHDVVTADEQFTVSFVIEGNRPSEFQWEPGEDFELLWGPQQGRSSSVQIVNGKRTESSQTTYSYVVKPIKPGKFTLPKARAVVEGKEIYSMGWENESVGTMRTFGIEAALFEAIQTQSVLPIDEVDTSLHPKLLEKILFEYLRTPSRTQLLVATHNDGLLDLVDDLIRKDSVWFTEKKKSGVTDLYKLTDFRGVNRLSSIREAYRNKRFGATMN